MTTSSTDHPQDRTQASRRTHHQLVAATRPFAKEAKGTSWFHLLSTFGVLTACLVAAALLPGAWRLVGSVSASLVMVRAFILFHDHMHGALLRNSRLARGFIRLYGCLVLTPPSAWKLTHDLHHANVGRLESSHIGGYRLLSVDAWESLSPLGRFVYRLQRSPAVILLAYPVVFLSSITIYYLVLDPRRHWDAALGLVLHVASITAMWLSAGWQGAFFVVLLPMCLAGLYGGYLFYAQHNFAHARVVREGSSVVEGALANSSYLRMGPVLNWVTGNIGYHHVHHVNAAIPFYALPKAMSAIAELREVEAITLHPRDVLGGLRLKLWDAKAAKMVGFSDAGN